MIDKCFPANFWTFIDVARNIVVSVRKTEAKKFESNLSRAAHPANTLQILIQISWKACSTCTVFSIHLSVNFVAPLACVTVTSSGDILLGVRDEPKERSAYMWEAGVTGTERRFKMRKPSHSSVLCLRIMLIFTPSPPRCAPVSHAFLRLVQFVPHAGTL